MPQTRELKARMKNQAMVIPDAMTAILNLLKATKKAACRRRRSNSSIPVRAKSMGISFCVDAGARSAKEAGESDERLIAVTAWREAPYFTDAERAMSRPVRWRAKGRSRQRP